MVRVSNKREGLSVISTVTNQGTVRWRVFDGAINADILIDFLKRLLLAVAVLHPRRTGAVM